MKTSFGSTIIFLMSVLFSIFFALLILWQAVGIGLEYSPEILMPLGLGVIVSLLGAFVVHELGHMIAGNDAGIQTQRIVLGVLAFTRRNGSLRPELNTKWFRIAFCVQYEHVDGIPHAEPWRKMVLGGPLASLFVGMACLVTAVFCSCGATTPDNGVIQPANGSRFLLYQGNLKVAWVGIAGVANVLVGAMTLIPGTVGKYRTDGGQLYDLRKFRKASVILGCSPDALLFISLTMQELVKRYRKENKGQIVHIGGREYCEYLLTSRGEKTPDILRGYGFCRSEDVGKLFFGLVSLGMLQKREEDLETDFAGVFNVTEPASSTSPAVL